MKNRIEWLSAALASELGFEVDGGSEFDKVIGLFSVNTVCFDECLGSGPSAKHIYTSNR